MQRLEQGGRFGVPVQLREERGEIERRLGIVRVFLQIPLERIGGLRKTFLVVKLVRFAALRGCILCGPGPSDQQQTDQQAGERHQFFHPFGFLNSPR